MKKLLLSITAVLALGYANAQIYSASDSVDFSTWLVYDNDGDGNNWFNLDIAGTSIVDPLLIAQGETMSSASYETVAYTPDNLLVSPAIDCSSSGTIFANWVAFSPEGGTSTFYAEKYAVYVVTQTQLALLVGLGTYPTPVFEETLPSGGVILNRSLDVSAIAGNQTAVHVIFRHYDCTDQNWLSIDDVSITSAMPVGLNEATLEASVYPNPTNDVLNIKTTGEAKTISIISMDGRVVATAAMSGLEGKINVSELVAGVYFYEVGASNGSVVRNTFLKK